MYVFPGELNDFVDYLISAKDAAEREGSDDAMKALEPKNFFSLLMDLYMGRRKLLLTNESLILVTIALDNVLPSNSRRPKAVANTGCPILNVTQ